MECRINPAAPPKSVLRTSGCLQMTCEKPQHASAQLSAAPARVAFLGPIGTYSHEVTQKRFPGQDYTLEPYASIHEAVHALLPPSPTQQGRPRASWAVVPLENSYFGPVLETRQVLEEPLVIRHTRTLDERISLNVHHCLIARIPAALSSPSTPSDPLPPIRKIFSHPQVINLSYRSISNRPNVCFATPIELLLRRGWNRRQRALGQCRQYIADHYPQAQTVATSSTAEAAALVADDASRSSLAIGSPSCITYFPQLFVLQFNIQDAGKENVTTFIVLKSIN